MEPWIIGSNPSERYPLWTRANVGEVFADPVAPLTYSYLIKHHTEPAWRDALVDMGAFTHEEFDPDNPEPIGIFGSYAYLNGSIVRVLGERGPGLSAQMIDDLFFGSQPGVPPYEPAPGDVNEDRTAAIGATFEWVMSTERLDSPASNEIVVNKLRAQRPNLDEMSNPDLWTYARELLDTHLRRLFGEHIYITFLSSVPVGALTQICTAIGRPEDAMRAISGLGDIESAAPSLAMWRLGREVASEPALSAAFDAGIDGLLNRLQALGETSQSWLADFERFLYHYGSRGPNEWEMRNQTWETRPELALAAIDRMRLADHDAAPDYRHVQMAAERERVTTEIHTALASDPTTQAMFTAASRSAALFQAGRERTKTNCIKLIHEARMAMHTVGRRLVQQGLNDDVSDFGLLLEDEIEHWLQDPASFRSDLQVRRDLFAEYSARQEPFIFYEVQPDPSTWPRRDAAQVTPVQVNETLTGFPGCPGKVTGIARVIHDPIDPTALEPGDILVAPITDPSWTPLFVSAGGVVVDVGATQSHAMIVSRELGIPCVPSVTQATQRIPDGATITVDGDAGTVTILALP